MSIGFTLSPEIEKQVRVSAAKGDATTVRKLLMDALEPIVKSLLQPGQSVEEFDELMKELDELPPTIVAPPLSEYAMSREGIYEDHPWPCSISPIPMYCSAWRIASIPIISWIPRPSRHSNHA